MTVRWGMPSTAGIGRVVAVRYGRARQVRKLGWCAVAHQSCEPITSSSTTFDRPDMAPFELTEAEFRRALAGLTPSNR
jgi:hypothetical protein